MLLLLFFPLVSNAFHILLHSVRNVFGKTSAYQRWSLSIYDCFDLIDFEFILILLALAFRHLEPCHSQLFPQGYFFDYFYACVCLLQCHCPKWNLVLLQSAISISFMLA